LVRAESGNVQCGQSKRRPPFSRSGHAGENARERINHAGALQAGAQHKHATNHNRRAVTEDAECFIRRKHAGDQQHTHRAQRHQIWRKPFAQERGENRYHQTEDDDEMKSVHAHF
jgi:hypothetical protein